MKDKKLNLNSVFLIILSIGIFCFGLLTLIILNTDRKKEFETWKEEKIKESSSNTSSYYSSLTTKIILNKNKEIQKLLIIYKNSEKLESIEIITPERISSKILETCVVNEFQSFFNQVPSCYELNNNSLLIYHELRSFGYNLGYLRKEIKINHYSIFKNKVALLNSGLMILIFLIVNITTLFFLRKFIVLPILDLAELIKKDSKIEKKFNIKEIQNIYKSLVKALHDVGEYQEKVNTMKIQSELGFLAKQISHDIRSPLAALKVVKDMGASGMEPDVAKLLTMSIDRITDIANTILPKNTVQAENKENAQSSFLWMLVDQIISEKRVEYKSASDISIDFKFDGSPFEFNAFCNATEFMRSISNIINNSIEAKSSDKKLAILVKLTVSGDQVLLNITDNGKGMTPETLSKAFSEGFTHGKSQGTGLGLYQVKKAIESWNGYIHIESQVGTGTAIIISLKKSPAPQWLIGSINVSKYQSMIVLDDEEYVFSILQDRFDQYFKDIRYFKKIEEFETHIQTSTNSLLFIDHDLKQSQTGIDLIQKYNLQTRSILLTGNYDDKQVQQRVAELGIKILPKPLINDLPIIT